MTILRDFDPRPVNALQSALTRVLATAGGAGYSPVAPGTAGTLAGCLVLYVLQPDFSSIGFLFATAAVYGVGVVVSSWAERLWQRSDPGHVCVDELAGLMLTVAFVPARDVTLLLAAAFLIFRLFDIVKPPPTRAAERARSGWGIMNDDMVAGLYANLVLQAISRLGWI